MYLFCLIAISEDVFQSEDDSDSEGWYSVKFVRGEVPIARKLPIFSCISRFVFKSTPVFQAKNNDIFESSCLSQPP